MSSFHPAFDFPKRISLAAQVTDAMRRAIEDNTWTGSLPSERRLCQMLQVSRPTIRKALHQLASDRVIEIQQGRRHRLIAKPQRNPRQDSRLVGIVTTEPVSNMALITYQGISEMRAQLSDHGFSTELLVCPQGRAQNQRRKLEAFVRQNRVFCCALLSVTREIQVWFQENRLPALVLGSCHADVRLPSLDVDYRSVCRHAAGIFLGRGHRHLAFVVPDSGAAGDLTSEQGFREAIEQHQDRNAVHASIVRHNGSAQQIGTKLDALFSSSHVPTALLVAKTQHVFVVLIYLLKRGLMVPDMVSFIARDHDHIFDIVSPPITHYSLPQDAYALRFSRLMLQMVTRGHLPSEPSLIFPKFLAGGTVRKHM